MKKKFIVFFYHYLRAGRRAPRTDRLSEGQMGRETVLYAGEHHPDEGPLGRAAAVVRCRLAAGAA